MARFKVVLTVINEDSVSPFVVGPRFRRGTPLPMHQLAADRGGYWFDPSTEQEIAEECAKSFQRYIEQADNKKKGKK